MKFLLGIIYLFVTGAVLLSASALVFRGRRNKSNWIFLICQGLVVIWCSSQIMQLLVRNLNELKFAYLYGNLGICFTGCMWLYFAYYYRKENIERSPEEAELVPVKHPILFLPFLFSCVHFFLVMTNQMTHIYYSHFEMGHVVHGPAFYTNVASTYIYVLIGAVILNFPQKKVENHLKDMGHFLIVAAVLVPVILNALFLLGIVQADFDITALGFAISVFLVMTATFKYQFIDLRRELAVTNEKLLLSQERNRIAQEVHDTTGHTLTMLHSYMKLAEVSITKNEPEEALAYVKEARGLSSEGIRQLRESINQIRSEEEYELVTQGLMQLTDRVKEIPVEVVVQGEDSDRYSHLTKLVYDTARECITNTLKYAQATKIDIVISFREDSLMLMVADNGRGCKAIEESNGIRGIRERAQKAGGRVTFITAEGEGFMTRLEVNVR